MSSLRSRGMSEFAPFKLFDNFSLPLSNSNSFAMSDPGEKKELLSLTARSLKGSLQTIKL